MYNPLWINVTWLVILCHPTHDDVEMWHRTNMSNLFCTNDERGITQISTILKWISPTIFAWYFRTVWCHVMAYGFQCSFCLLTKNHGTGSIGWVLWWSRQWIKRLRRKLFISCFMKISAFIQTSVSLGAYQNDGSKPSYIFFHTWNIFRDEMIHTHTHDLHAANWIIITEMYIIACRHTNDLCKCIHSLEMQSNFFFLQIITNLHLHLHTPCKIVVVDGDSSGDGVCDKAH